MAISKESKLSRSKMGLEELIERRTTAAASLDSCKKLEAPDLILKQGQENVDYYDQVIKTKTAAISTKALQDYKVRSAKSARVLEATVQRLLKEARIARGEE